MTLDADNARAGVTGAIYVAPTGTTLPTSAADDLDPAFTDLGYISDAGVVENQGSDRTTVKAWQRGTTVRKIQTSHDLTYAFTMLETKDATLETFYGNAAGGVVEIKADTLDHQVFVIDVIDGDDIIRLVVPDGEVTDRREVTYKNDALIAYPVTVTCYEDASGVKAYRYDDAATGS